MALLLACLVSAHLPAQTANFTLTNVSYDPTRELYKEYNTYFSNLWKNTAGNTVNIQVSHGASGSQARAVAEGLEADVVTWGYALRKFGKDPDAQDIIARHYYRPRDPPVAERYRDKFPKIELFDVESLGGWAKLQKIRFADGGVFDQIYGSGR